jgi:hypothetical protein
MAERNLLWWRLLLKFWWRWMDVHLMATYEAPEAWATEAGVGELLYPVFIVKHNM